MFCKGKLASGLQPTFYHIRTVLRFPGFKNLVLAAFRFDNFAIIWIFVNLNLAWCVSLFICVGRLTMFCNGSLGSRILITS